MSNYSDAVNALAPISYYRLNELTGSTVAVDAQSNYPGVYEGATTFDQPGLVVNDLDTSIRFGDSPNRLHVATAPDLTGDFSISFLMNTHTISIYQNIIRHVINYAIYLNNGRFDFYGAGSNLVGPTLSINTTYHVVLVRESGVGKVYIDGITDGSTATYTHTLSHTECFGNSSGGQSYLGHADEFAIFDKALIQAEITNLYEISVGYVDYPVNYKETILHYIPLVYWRLDESLGTTALDTVGNNDGTYAQGYTLDYPSLLVDDANGSVHFDSNGYMIATDAHVGTAETSVSFLFELTNGLFDFQDVFCFYGSSYTDRIMFQVTATGAIRLYKDTVQFWVSSAGEIDADTKYHIVITDNGVDTLIYINGVLSHTLGTWLSSVTDGKIYLAAYEHNVTIFPRFIGKIDEFATFGSVLNQTAVDVLYNASLGTFLGQLAFDIVIDHTKVDEDLYDFPMLVNLGASSGIDSFDSSAIFDKLNPVTSNDGFDPLFTGALITLSGANNDIATCTLAGWESTFTSQTIVAGEIKYFEYEILTVGLSADIMFGVAFDTFNLTNYFASGTNDGLYITNATTYLWPTGTVLTLPSGLSIGDVIGIKFQYDGMLITFYKNGTEYETIDLIAVSAAVQATSPGKVALSLNKLDASVQLKLQASEFSYSTPTGATPWGQTGDTDLTPITAVYINPADDHPPNYESEVLAINPTAFWRLSDLSGVVAVDETGNYNGTYVGTPTFNEVGLLVDDTNPAVIFTSGNHLYYTDNTLFNVSTITMGCIVEYSTYAPADSIIMGINDNQVPIALTDKVMFLDATGKIGFYTYTGSLNYIYSNDVIPLDTPIHIICMVDDVGSRMYINGVLQTETSSAGSHTGYTTATISVGGSSDGTGVYRHHDVKIDEVFVVSAGVLTSADVLRLYNESVNASLPSDSTVYSRQCKVEVDRWDQANEQAQLHIKIPYISKDVDTIVNLSYDPTNADNSANVGVTGTLPAQQVWTEYDAVYHLSADGADSTINALDGTLVNIDDTNIVDFGIGKGLSFNATNEAITLGDNFDVRDTDVVFSAIIEVNAVGIGNQHFFSKSLLASLIGRWWIGVSGDKIYVNLESSNTIIRTLTSITTIAPNTEYIIDVMWDRDGVLSLYINGAIDNTANWSAYSADYDITCPALIGAYNNNPCTNIYYGSAFAGTLKEFRFDKVLKPVGWLSTNYNSSQDTLVRYSNADSYVLAKSILGSITETVAVVDWLIRAYRLDTGELTAQLNAIAGNYQLAIPNGHWVPTSVVCTPEQGVLWTPLTAQLVDDLIYPNDPETTPYYFKCTVSGTGIDGVTASVEPPWSTTPGQTVVDGTVTWEVVERMIQPIVHSPMIPK